MKKIASLILAGLLSLTACSKKEDKKPAPKPAAAKVTTVAKPVLSAAGAARAAEAAKTTAERDYLGQKAAWYLVALGDSLISTEVSDNKKFDVGTGFPGAIRAVEDKFASKAFRISCGISFSGTEDNLSVTTDLVIIDTLGGKSVFSNARKK